MNKLKTLLNLIFLFLKIGAFTFGGGYAMLGVVEKEVAEKRKWLTAEEMADAVAIAESTPGAIALNLATYIGAKVLGFFGALCAAIAVILPSAVIISLVAWLFSNFADNQYVYYASLGVRAAVCALMLNAIIKLSKPVEKKWVSLFIIAVSATFALLGAFGVLRLNVVFILLAAAAFGVIYGIVVRKIKTNKRPIHNSQCTMHNDDDNLNNTTTIHDSRCTINDKTEVDDADNS
jgi:chromate transporter